MEINLQHVLDRIKEQKKNLKLTNEDLAIKAGLPKGTLSKILSGETKDPKITTLISIADALNVSVNFLAYGKEAASQDFTLNNKEQSHIKKYRALDERGQQTVDMVLNAQYELVSASKQSSASSTAAGSSHRAAAEALSYEAEHPSRAEMHRMLDEELDATERGQTSPASTCTESREVG